MSDILNRRTLLAALGALPLLGIGARGGLARPGPCGKATLNSSGLHVQPWFVQGGSLNMAQELARARQQGKKLAVLVEQKGCPYCKTLHEKYFTDASICKPMRAAFRVVQINLRGARRVKDFDGTTMTEKEWARKHLRLGTTPSLLFFTGDAAAIARKSPRQRAVASMEGLYQPDAFRRVLARVRNRG